jgi:hypothetical protein
MAGGTDGNLITYDASGDPAYVTTGTSGQVLTSGGTGVAPTFQTSTHTPDDNSVTLAKMAHGTDGELITYDATGAPANVAVGTSGQVLTSGGVGVAPTFQTAAGGGKVLQVVAFLTSTQGSTTLSTSATSTNPAITKSITPLGNSSNFLISVRWHGEGVEPNNNVGHIYRGSSRLNGSGSNSYNGLTSATITGTNDSSSVEVLTIQTLDTTGSTTGTSITYELKFTAPGSRNIWTNRAIGGVGSGNGTTGTSEIIITEIGA